MKFFIIPQIEVTVYRLGIAYLLWLVSGFGALGFHRFYLGKIFTGILWLCTGGLGMVGSIYDLITLPWQVRDANLRRAIFNQMDTDRASQQSQPQQWRSVNDGETRIVDE